VTNGPEGLCRYVARPPIAHDRLEARSDGRLALRLKTRWRDGTTHILMQRHELLERLVPLIPPPRAHQVRYHGVLAPCASARKRIVPGPRLPPGPADPEANGPILTANPEPDGMRARPPKTPPCTDADSPADPSPANVSNGSEALAAALPGAPPTDGGRWATRSASDPAADRPVPRRLAWAELLQRVFEVDALCCPGCGGRMRLVASIQDPEAARKILACLDLPARAPPLEPASGESVRLGHDPDPWNDDPGLAFDQTPPDSDCTA
jgi:hypothetical protein